MSVAGLRLGCVGVHLLVAALVGLLLFRAIGTLWALALSLPLVALLPGIYKLTLSRLRLTTIIIVPYLTVAVMEVVANGEVRGIAGAIVFGLLVELVCLIALIRVVQAHTVLQHAANERNS